MITGEVKLGSTTLQCSVSFAVLVEIERLTDISLPRIFKRYAESDIRSRDVVSIIFCASDAVSPGKHTFNQIGDMVFEHGLMDASVQALMLIKDSLTGPEKKKELQSEPNKSQT